MREHAARQIDPTPGTIAEMLEDAAARANGEDRERLLKSDPATWRKLARETTLAAEGVTATTAGRGSWPTSQVVLAWWTDHVGRKHVIVRGRRIMWEEHADFLRPGFPTSHPPLWHIYPDRVYRRKGERYWRAACGCGGVGTPETLGWMGDVCGPCHDRREEFGPAALADHPPGMIPTTGVVTGLAFDPAADRIALCEVFGPIRLVSLAGVDEQEILRDGNFNEITCGFTASGDYLFFSEPGEQSQVSAYDMRPNRGRTLLRRFADGFDVVQGPGPNGVIARNYNGFVTFDLGARDARAPARYLSPPESDGWEQLPFPSVDGTRIVNVYGNSFIVYDAGSGAEVGRAAHSQWMLRNSTYRYGYHIHYFDDLSRLMVASGSRLETYDMDSGRLLEDQNLNFGDKPEIASATAFSVATDTLFVGTRDGTVAAFDADTLECLDAFDWHLGPVNVMAVSPDGGTLATAGVEGGVKLWPVRRLLPSSG